MMKKQQHWLALLLLALLSLSMQSCLGLGSSSGSSNTSNFKTTSTNASQKGLGINQSSQFKLQGKLYFTQAHRLYVLDDTRTPHALTPVGMSVYDPAISPDGKWLAFIARYPDYSDLDYMATGGGQISTVVTGKGDYYPNQSLGANNYYWFSQPTWAPDGKSITFLSDLQKQYYWSRLGGVFANAYFEDLQVFSLPFGGPSMTATQAINTAQPIAYADFGDGGDSYPNYRPGNTDEIAYTHFTYDTNGTSEIVQIYLENANTIAQHPGMYHPGVEGSGLDPSVALTPHDTTQQSMEPAFSPDGNTLAYVKRIDATHMALYSMPVANGVTSDPNNPVIAKQALLPFQQSSLIVEGQYVSLPLWSPDGKQIAYLTYTNNELDIWLANLTQDLKTGTYTMKGSPVQLTSGGVDGDSRLFWTN